jgi:hypothetical protein
MLALAMQQARSSADPVSLFIPGTAAIPRGHEVELVTYARVLKSLFGNVKETFLVLTDLVTGVMYTPWVNENDTPPWEEDDVSIEARVRGRVLRCQVQTMTNADGTAWTRLLVDADPRPVER